MELWLGMDEEVTKHLWVKIKGMTELSHIKVGSATGHLTRKTEKMRPSTD